MQPLLDHIAKDGFRLRGTAMSRVDGFSDVVFGFALTLLVVSLEVPHTYDEFHTVLLGFYPFAICFLFLISVWLAHFKFFRRYSLHDMGTIWINCALLFAVLFYVYPLKFLFSFVTVGSYSKVFSNPYQLRDLMIVYGAGFGAIYLCVAALYWNAWRQRVQLHLNPLEVTLTLGSLWNYAGDVLIALLVCLTAWVLPLNRAGFSGYVFFLIFIRSRIHVLLLAPRLRRARARTPQKELLPIPLHG